MTYELYALSYCSSSVKNVLAAGISHYPLSAVALLAERQEGHLACKTLLQQPQRFFIGDPA